MSTLHSSRLAVICYPPGLQCGGGHAALLRLNAAIDMCIGDMLACAADLLHCNPVCVPRRWVHYCLSCQGGMWCLLLTSPGLRCSSGLSVTQAAALAGAQSQAWMSGQVTGISPSSGSGSGISPGLPRSCSLGGVSPPNWAAHPMSCTPDLSNGFTLPPHSLLTHQSS